MQDKSMVEFDVSRRDDFKMTCCAPLLRVYYCVQIIALEKIESQINTIYGAFQLIIHSIELPG